MVQPLDIIILGGGACIITTCCVKENISDRCDNLSDKTTSTTFVEAYYL